MVKQKLSLLQCYFALCWQPFGSDWAHEEAVVFTGLLLSEHGSDHKVRLGRVSPSVHILSHSLNILFSTSQVSIVTWHKKDMEVMSSVFYLDRNIFNKLNFLK